MSKIILIRHGESEANVDHSLYMTVPDHKINLTKKGYKQAKQVGKLISKILKKKRVNAYISPYKRTLQTWKGISSKLKNKKIREEFDPRLREQQFKIFKTDEDRLEKFSEQKAFSKFYYRFGKGGESGADVYSRISTFLNELRIDRRVFNDNHDCVIVTHNLALSSILMKLLKLSTDEFDQMPEIENCAPIVLDTKHFRKAKVNRELSVGNKDLFDFLDSISK